MVGPVGLTFELNLSLNDYFFSGQRPHFASSPAAASSTGTPPPWCTADVKGFARGGRHELLHDQAAHGARGVLSVWGQEIHFVSGFLVCSSNWPG